ncbi:MAG: TonB-dependent receptor [Bacteroidetes bacterium]|nr:MAG: TonB-dependent receptor [Bacteroidota bacterium]
MKLTTKHLLSVLLGLLCSTTTLAQSSPVEIRGKVVLGENQQAVEFATVMVVDAATQKPLTAATTAADGSFRLRTTATDFYVEVSFIGFEKQTFKNLQPVEGIIDLQTIALQETAYTLDEVHIRAEKSKTEFKLDKRVFHVGQDLSSTGASVLEVLNNVPSVNVNIEGQISLRGSQGVQILINGKPSVLASEEGNALGTITADMIDRIEVITNPSAKYDAEGTSGIINIVIKKEERKGINGSFSLNTGLPHNHSFGLSMNRRTEKFNLFTQLGVGYRELPSKNENINRDLTDNSAILSNGTDYRNETFYNVVLGTDYHINKYNVLTLSGNFAYEVEKQPSQTHFSMQDESGEVVAQWDRAETTSATNPKWQYELQYKSDFKDHKDHDLLFSALGNFFGKDQSSVFDNTVNFGTDPTGDQQTRTNFKEARYTFKLDYTKPLSKTLTLETGAQYFISDVSNDYAVSDWTDGEWVQNPGLTNIFDYHQKVLGIYGTGAYEGEKWGIKLGLRAENTNLHTLLVNTAQNNRQNFTNLFPSVHTSYKFTETLSLQAGYSRRIFRPRMWDLNPFFNIRNNFSIRTGNPELLPEFTDSYELNSIYVFEKVSLNFGIFHRYTTDVVERISTFENEVTTFKPLNIGTERSTGLEFNAKYTPSKSLSFNGDFNLLTFNRQGSFQASSFDFRGERWSAKLTAKLKLPAKLEAEVTGHYRSGYQTVQGEVSGNLFADLGLRQKIMNGRGVLNLSVRDIFASRFRESETIQRDFYLYSRGQRGRFITFGFSYGFGKGEAMEYSGQRRRH